MGVMAFKKDNLLFLLIAASLLSVSLAGRQRDLIDRSSIQEGAVEKDSHEMSLEDVALVVHPRILAVKTNDYGRSDPAPALRKPPFKLIPN